MKFKNPPVVDCTDEADVPPVQLAQFSLPFLQTGSFSRYPVRKRFVFGTFTSEFYQENLFDYSSKSNAKINALTELLRTNSIGT